MSAENTNPCPTCGAEIPSAAPGGMCPKCLLNQNDILPGVQGVDDETILFSPDDDRTMAMDPSLRESMAKEPKAEQSPEDLAEKASDAQQGAQQFAPTIEALSEMFPQLEIVELLGAGGMGAVYKARQPRLDRFIALKILSCPKEHHENFALRFELEAQLLAKLNHPNIVSIYDFGEIERASDEEGTNLFYFMMEFVDGADLNRLIHAGGLEPAQALMLIPQICDALQFAHDEGIFHRDIKPANILVDQKGNVRIADFGLAKLIGADQEEAMMTGLTMTGTSMGTPHYMAPEQWDAPGDVDHRADIYSLGVVFYEMLTGERPHGIFESPSEKSGVDGRIDEVVMKAMEREPNLRYQQASEVKDDVTRVVSGPVEVPGRGRGRPLVGIAAAVGLFLVLGVGGWIYKARWGAKHALLQVGHEELVPITVESPNHSSVQGHLRSLGTMSNGDPPDLSKVADYNDLIDVGGSADDWVVLRENGETISYSGGADFQNIGSIGWSYNSLYALIDRTGKLRFPEGSEMKLPDSFEEAVLVDVKVGNEHGIGLTEDGRALVFGARYNEQVGDPTDERSWGTPKWPLPPKSALSGIKDIAVTTTHAATLKHDGTLSVFGWEGEFDVPETKGVARIEALGSSEDRLLILDIEGQVWEFPLPRNPSPAQPIQAKGLYIRKLSSGDRADALEGHSWLGESGRWYSFSPYLNDLFESNPFGTEQSVFVATAGIRGQTKFRSLLWIESEEEREFAAEQVGISKGGPKASPGKLIATGTYSNGEPIDLSKAEGINDFVKVLLQSNRWIGLRENGETISSDGLADRKGVIDFYPVNSNGLALLKEDSGFEFVSHKKGQLIPVSSDLPATIGEIGINDFAATDYHGILLLKDGDAEVWGDRYDHPEKIPKWLNPDKPFSRPPEAALTGVVSVAAGSTWAGTVTDDGRLWLWDYTGIIEKGDLGQFQGDYVALRKSAYGTTDAVLRDGRILRINQTTDRYEIAKKRFEISDIVDTGYRSFYRDAAGEWYSPWGVKGLASYLKSIKGRDAVEFSLNVTFNGYDGGAEQTTIGLIKIELESGVSMDAGGSGGPLEDSDRTVRALPGKLIATGTYSNGAPIDLSKAEGINDFVKVLLQSDGWMGLRSNRETVSSDGFGDRKNVVDLFPLEKSGFVLLKEDQTLELVLYEFGKTVPVSQDLPDGISEIGIRDVAAKSFHGVLLLSDGTARVWGERYDPDKKIPGWGRPDERFKHPPAAALRNVVSVAAGQGWAGTVTVDGRLWIWNDSGIVDLGESDELQGNFTYLRKSPYAGSHVVLKDGRIFGFNYSLRRFSVGSRKYAISDMAFGGHRPLYRDEGGNWFVPWNESELAGFLKPIKERGSEAFALNVFYEYTEEGEKTFVGLIEIQSDSKFSP